MGARDAVNRRIRTIRQPRTRYRGLNYYCILLRTTCVYWEERKRLWPKPLGCLHLMCVTASSFGAALGLIIA